jgi:FlaA1/EpsC-like NDP-sugar epimerase
MKFAFFSRDEKKQDDMRHHYKNDKIKYYIGDVRNIQSLNDAMYGVDYAFHAAALKQVPSCEFFPIEAVATNVLGTNNVLTAAIAAGVKKVICLSTDKAAYPVNAMGTSKAMMEKVFVAKARTKPAPFFKEIPHEHHHHQHDSWLPRRRLVDRPGPLRGRLLGPPHDGEQGPRQVHRLRRRDRHR